MYHTLRTNYTLLHTMEQLDALHTLSITELRKVLTDNGVKETGSSKDELREQVSEIILTNIMIQSMAEESVPLSTSSQVVPSSQTESSTRDPRTSEREQQDVDYRLAVERDTIQSLSSPYAYDENGDYIIEQPDQSMQDQQGVSVEDMRRLRMQYYDNIA